ncbi:uncharacterized protein LOC133829491 [Humulus lupulus]|uniref:uncharacterized protein LOC133829491 n=1 Tax=Humulus lupulus TaxID=3486 RepID=UPI002B40C2EE|nr:uncharacterized protein LOC133829491 [Humulus lupulus]
MLTTFNRWVLGEIDNNRPRKLECCDGTPVWFLKLKVAKEWLAETHLDAANYLIRRRLFEFPKTYPVKATVLDSSFAQYIPARYEEFKKNGRTYQWDSDILDFLKGDAKKYKKPWGDCNEVYFHWCMENRHWVLCEIYFADWMITVFDSDHSNFSHNKLSELMEPWTRMLPSLLNASGMFKGHPKLKIARPKITVPNFDWRRMSTDIIPQSRTSEDCGVFAIKHLEFILGDIPLSYAIEDNIQYFRDKLCIDIFL